jgi:hypothetical protein
MSSESGIEVKAGFFPLAFFLFFCSPRIVIDGGEPVIKSWGTHWFPVAPGSHRVKVYFKYMGMAECGANERTVEVPPGQTVPVTFYMWPWMFSPGSMKVLSPRAQLPKATVR